MPCEDDPRLPNHRARFASLGFQNALQLSASIAFYRPQAEFSGGRFDGKSSTRWEEVSCCQLVIRAGDNWVGVKFAPPDPATVPGGHVRAGLTGKLAITRRAVRAERINCRPLRDSCCDSDK